MDILKRSLAPIIPEAWNEIDEQARTTIKQVLAGRKAVDVKGPLGWDCNAVPYGTLTLAEETPVEGVNYGTRDVLPLVEIRVPFTMPMWDLDDISRGSKIVDFSPIQEAARKAALFEDAAVFKGLEDAGILGLESQAVEEVEMDPTDDNAIVEALVEAVQALAEQNVAGPYALVCPLQLWKKIQTSIDIYPLKKRVLGIIGEESRIVLSSQCPTALLVSIRGGDSELIIGQDFSVGYQSHTSTDVDFYITESFTFRVLAPESIVLFTLLEEKKPAPKKPEPKKEAVKEAITKPEPKKEPEKKPEPKKEPEKKSEPKKELEKKPEPKKEPEKKPEPKKEAITKPEPKKAEPKKEPEKKSEPKKPEPKKETEKKPEPKKAEPKKEPEKKPEPIKEAEPKPVAKAEDAEKK